MLTRWVNCSVEANKLKTGGRCPIAFTGNHFFNRGHENDMRALLLAIAAGNKPRRRWRLPLYTHNCPLCSPHYKPCLIEGSVNGAAWNGDESQILTWSDDGTANLGGGERGAVANLVP